MTVQRFLFACCFAIGLTVHPMVSTCAYAQGAEDEAYKATISEAVAEFSAGRWEEARSLFTEAHRIYPNARTLRGLGMAAFELRNYVEAIQMLRQSLRSEVNPLTADQRAKTEELLARTRTFVGTYTIEGPEGMTLSIDGLPAAYDDEGHLLLNTGKHTLTATFSDSSSTRRLVDVRGGEEGSLVFDPSVAPGPASPPVPVPLETEPNTASVRVSSSDAGPPVLPIVLMGAGGAMVVGGVVTGLLAKGAQGELDDACSDMKKMCPESLEDNVDKAKGLAMVTNVLWIGGAVLAGLGVTLLLLDDGEEPPVSAGFGFGPDGAGMNVRGQF